VAAALSSAYRLRAGMGSERIDPLFFGTQERRLYGCHHGPAEGGSSKLGLVIAPALGHEYSRAHRALRQLASTCASGGLRALRFDFSATGDSSGDVWPDSLETWREDLELAARELSLRTRVARTALLGVRLSANLALDCAAKNPRWAALVLWDPCFDGDAFVRALERLQARFESTLPAAAHARRSTAGGLECQGFLWPAPLIENLRAWRPSNFDRGAPARVLILEAELSPGASALAQELARRGASVRHERSSGSQPWNEEVDEGLVPIQDLRRIVDFLGEVN
jgi:hypothetical protein